MIEITAEAQRYFERLIAQQDESGLGLRISVKQPGTPNASCDLQFCPAGENREADRVIAYPAFNLFVAEGSESWLEQAQIDFEENATGGQLTIRAPGIKGSQPAGDAPIEQRIEWLLESEINPHWLLTVVASRWWKLPEKWKWCCSSGGGDLWHG
jgi:Fe/S biogenesis protein NfuA